MKLTFLAVSMGTLAVLGISGCADPSTSASRPAYQPITPKQLPAAREIDFPDVPPSRVIEIAVHDDLSRTQHPPA